jgi:uncharacterized protein (TIGR00251 family)
MLKYSETDKGITFSIRVQPRASRSEISGQIDGVLKLRLAAPPVDGEANEECIRFLSKLMGIGKGQVEIVSGQTSRNKIIRISGITKAQFEQVFCRD